MTTNTNHHQLQRPARDGAVGVVRWVVGLALGAG